MRLCPLCNRRTINVLWYGMVCIHETKIMDWRGRVLAAEATKAGVASEDTFLIPRPPSVIGKVA